LSGGAKVDLELSSWGRTAGFVGFVKAVRWRVETDAFILESVVCSGSEDTPVDDLVCVACQYFVGKGVTHVGGNTNPPAGLFLGGGE
jgi:hypothetical protein